MDVEAASVIEVFPAEEWELASFVVGDASIRGRGARAWASDGAEGGGEQEEEEPATAEDELSGRPGSTRAESSNQPEEIRPKSGWVGFVDFGDHAGEEGDDPGPQPERPRTRFGRGPKERKGRKRKERIRPAAGGGGGTSPGPGPGPPAAPGVPSISLTEPTPPASLSEDSEGAVWWGGGKSASGKRGGRKRGSGVEALDKYHWDARKKRSRRSDARNGVEVKVTGKDRGKADEGSRTTTNVLEKNGEVLALKVSLSSKAISTSSLRSVDSAVHGSSGPCSCSPKHGRKLCKGTVLVSLGMAIAGALYFGSSSLAGTPMTAAQIMDAFNCTSLTDCKTDGESEAESALISRWANETEQVISGGGGDICAWDHCTAPCSAAAVRRCDDGLCVLKRACEDFNDNGGVAGAARVALIGILVFAIGCLVVAAALVTPHAQKLCSHCFLRNRGGGARG